jgi:hypothetical protein
MTLATQKPPHITTHSSTTEQSSAKSIFVSKTFWGVVFTAIAAIAPIVGDKIDAHEFKAKDAAQIIVILCGAASAIAGRVDAGSVYTPKGCMGPNKSDFN